MIKIPIIRRTVPSINASELISTQLMDWDVTFKNVKVFNNHHKDGDVIHSFIEGWGYYLNGEIKPFDDSEWKEFIEMRKLKVYNLFDYRQRLIDSDE